MYIHTYLNFASILFKNLYVILNAKFSVKPCWAWNIFNTFNVKLMEELSL